MDSWSEKQIRTMDFGGNAKFNNFLQQHKVTKDTPIHGKNISYGARLYKDRINAELEGRDPPESIPDEPAANQSQVSQSSDLLPGETEAQYVARQRKLQEEARERMRKKFGGSSGLSGGGRMEGIGSSGVGSSSSSSDYASPASYLTGNDVGLNVDLDHVQKTVSGKGGLILSQS